MIDSGAGANFICDSKLRELKLDWKRNPEDLNIKVANGNRLQVLGRRMIRINGKDVEFLVADIKTKADFIHGYPWM